MEGRGGPQALKGARGRGGEGWRQGCIGDAGTTELSSSQRSNNQCLAIRQKCRLQHWVLTPKQIPDIIISLVRILYDLLPQRPYKVTAATAGLIHMQAPGQPILVEQG